MSVVVFGPINMDLVVRTPRLPGTGEMLAATFLGGKRANQAVACARLGVEKYIVGREGSNADNGALAAALNTGQSMTSAKDWAIAAGALATTVSGAQLAMPNRTSMLELIDVLNLDSKDENNDDLSAKLC